MNLLLKDSLFRDKFKERVDCNFSLIAPAGVGKTHSIVERILGWIDKKSVPVIRSDSSRVEQKLVVVTYTEKAAKEMEDRTKIALHQIKKHHAVNSISEKLNNIFFGTIHSFCFQIIQKFGCYEGIAPNVKISNNLETLWIQFLRSEFFIENQFLLKKFSFLFKIYPLEDMFKIVNELQMVEGCSLGGGLEEIIFPVINGDIILSYKTENKRLERGIEKEKAIFKEWFRNYLNNDLEGIPVPTAGGEEFIFLYNESLVPLRDYLSKVVLMYGVCLSDIFREFRKENDMLTYDDIIFFAKKLIQNEKVFCLVKNENYSILLDEAQDTDVNQFEIIINCVSRERIEIKDILEGKYNQIESGRFSMVGDPQQIIYQSRTNNIFYQKIQELVEFSEMGEALRFSVTFRCASNIVQFVNSVFPVIFENYIEYENLDSKENAISGEVVYLDLEFNLHEYGSGVDIKTAEYVEAEKLAEWIKVRSCGDLMARDWNEVAIICPRNAWLKPFGNAFRKRGIKFQILNKNLKYGERSTYAWITGLIAVMVEPTNSFELTGVVREFFGVSDELIAEYISVQATKADLRNVKLNPLQIFDISLVDESSLVGDILIQLHHLRNRIRGISIRAMMELFKEELGLLEKLKKVENESIEEINKDWGDILKMGLEFDRDKRCVEDFFYELKQLYSLNYDNTCVLPGHIQLLTAHSAKGLEWDCVIVPYFYRPIYFRNKEYPQIFIENHSIDRKVQLIIDSVQKDEEVRGSVTCKMYNELKNLLYVGMTRPRNLLVILNDANLFEDRTFSFGDIAKSEFGRENFGVFERLVKSYPKNEEDIRQEESLKKEGSLNFNFSIENIEYEEHSITGDSWMTQCYMKRKTPSRLGHVREEKEKEEGGGGAYRNRALSYGIWWHECMRFFPYGESSDVIRRYIEGRVGQLDDHMRGRGSLEWETFFGSECYEFLKREHILKLMEWPVVGKMEEGVICEGIVDLVGYDSVEKKIYVFDWKTDFLKGEDEWEKLVERYSPQMGAYRQLISKNFHCTVEVYLYSTKLGIMKLC